jgi:hypothetical protein
MASTEFRPPTFTTARYIHHLVANKYHLYVTAQSKTPTANPIIVVHHLVANK